MHGAQDPPQPPRWRPQIDGADDEPIYNDAGVDLTLIRWFMSLTPIERLRTAQEFATAAEKMMEAARAREL